MLWSAESLAESKQKWDILADFHIYGMKIMDTAHNCGNLILLIVRNIH
jgi:hypothetical protein